MLMKYSNNIRFLREARKLTLEQLAELSGLSPGYISRLETNGRNLSVKTMAKLQKPLGAAPRDMLPAGGPSVDDALKELPPETSRELMETFLRTIRLAKKLGKANG